VTVKYDAHGNLLTDNLNNTYTWDPNWGNMLTVTSGSATVTNTYDAFGRMVENNAGGTYGEFVYGPTGTKLAKVNGTTLVKAFVALPGGAKAIYSSSGLTYFRHSDWLGSSRLTSTATQPTSMYSSTAYAPFGEQYATAGTADASFTGQDQDTVSSLYDFPARRQSPSQGRWISPDPAGRHAANPANPQSWNRYAYVQNNPLALIDPLGLDDQSCDMPGEDNCGDDVFDTEDYGDTAAEIQETDDTDDNIDESEAEANSFTFFANSAFLIAGFDDDGAPSGTVSAPQTAIVFDCDPSDPSCGETDDNNAPPANNGNCGITVKCRGIQTDNLGKIGMQHCDAQVTDSSGQLWSLSGGPQPNYMSITALNAWATSPPTEPFTGTTVYQGNGCSAAGCMIQSTQAWNQDIVKPEYRPVSGPNSNTWLKGTAAGCGVSLPINTWGSTW
jgi:RHS repeat-associated protein